MSFENPIVGGTVLRIPAIQSPNYVPGVSGWAIFQNGNAEFDNITIRGQFEGTDFVIDNAGIFFYNGTPAAGNLLISIANTAGTDAFTNTYPEGISISQNGESVVLGLTGGAPLIYFVSGTPNLTNGAALQDITLGAGTGRYDFLQILSAENTTNNDLVLQGFGGSSQDGTQLAEIIQQYKDNLGVFHTFYTLTKNGAVFPLGVAVNGTLTQALATATTGAIQIEVTGDADPRHTVRADGQTAWGPGNAATDTFLQRAAAGVLATLKNYLIGSSTALGDNGVGELQLANAATVPTTNPAGGLVLYAHQGVPSVRDPGGNLLGMVRTYQARATGQLSNFTTEADVPGATVQVTVTGSNATIQVTAFWDCNCGTGAATMVGFFNWNGSDQPSQGIHQGSAAGQRDTVGQTYTITGITAGTYTAKLRASCTASGNLNQVGGQHTGFNILLVDQ